MNSKRFGHSVASILLLILAALLIGVGNARADQSAEDHAAHHPKQEAKAVGAAVAPTTKTVEELRAKIAKLEAQLKEKTGGMGMGMMMGGGKEGGGMGMKGMGMMGGSGKDSPQGMKMSCCMCDGAMMMKDQQQKAPTTQPQHSHDHK